MSNKGFKNYLNRYEFEYTLPGTGETVKFKPLTTSQMKQLLDYENEKSIGAVIQALDSLIKSSVISENFNIDELYLRDRFSLLVEIRKKTKGEQYEFQFRCPSCESQQYNVVDLDSLETKTMEVENGEIEISDGVVVNIGHVKVKDEREAIADLETMDFENDRKKEAEY